MYIRPKTQRRLLILAVVVLGVGVPAALLFMLHSRQAGKLALNARAAGLTAYHDGDYTTALKQLGNYLDKSGATRQGANPDPEALYALFAYGRSRQLTPVKPNSRQHQVEATHIFETYLTFRPDDLNAQHTLLALYNEINYQKEAVRVADDILAAHPDDVEALWVKGYVLWRQPKPALAEALKVVERLNRVAPTDLRGQIQAQRLRLQLNAKPDDLIARAEALRKQYDGDPRFELLQGVTFLALAAAQQSTPDQALRADWLQKGQTWLQTAAGRNAPDAEYVRHIVDALDRQRMFPQSLAVLQNAVDKSGIEDRSIIRGLVQRLWESGHLKLAADRTAKLDPSSADARLVAYRALALYHLATIDRDAGAAAAATTLPTTLPAAVAVAPSSTRPAGPAFRAQAEAVVAALAGRTSDVTATSWASVLRARFGDGAGRVPEVRDQLQQYRAATQADPENAFAHYLAGEGYAALREVESAKQSWEQAARRAPQWALPHAMVARALLAEGRDEDAFARAYEARRRAPNLRSVLGVYAIARYAYLIRGNADGAPAPKPADLAELLEQVQKIQEVWPGDAETLPLYVTLLARTGKRDAALVRLNAALTARPPLPAETLTRLEAINHAENLGLGEGLLERAGDATGGAAPSAMRRARELADAGKPAEGYALLQNAQAKAKGQDDPYWKLTLLAYRERADAPTSELLKAWVELADANPKDATIQTTALRSPLRKLDRAFWKRTIERVRTLTGDGGQAWRIEQCRWLLTSDAERDRAEALVSLTELARRFPSQWEVRRLLGAALAMDNKLPLAIQEFTAALKLRPGDVEVVLELIHAQRLAGNPTEARAQLDQLAQRPGLSVEARRKVAAQLEEDGRPERAIEVLTAGPATAPATTRPGADGDAAVDGTLARLYRRAGRGADAEALYRKLTANDDASVGDLVAAAEFFAAGGKMNDARAALDRVRAQDLRPGAWEIIQGRFNELFVSDAEALPHFTAATVAEPKSAEPWRALAGFQMRQGRLPDAQAAIDKGLVVAPTDANLVALKRHASLLQTLPRPSELQPLTDLLTTDPRHAAAGEMLKVLGEAQVAGASTPEARAAHIDKLRDLADRFPSFLPAQEHVARQYLATGQFDRAATVAERASQAFPYDPEPARLATMAYAAQASAGGRTWDKMLDAATQWRQRARANPLPADLAMAEAMIGQERPQLAVQQLEPHVKGASLPDDASRLRLYAVYARALLASGRAPEAAALLQPLLASNREARGLWLALSRHQKTADAATAWVEKAVPSVVLSDKNERLALADAWYDVGQAFGASAAYARARDVLKPLTEQPDADPKVWELSAHIAQELNDYATAEAGWRMLIKAGVNDPAVRNNLAYVLLFRADAAALTEAARLAEQAIAAAPNRAVFHDTLARIHSRSGNADLAVKAYRTALAKEPEHLDAMIGLADELRGSRRKEDVAEVKSLLGKINAALKRSPPLSTPLQKQLDNVRMAVVPIEESSR